MDMTNNADEYSKRAEKRLENIKTHARMPGEDSSWFMTLNIAKNIEIS